MIYYENHNMSIRKPRQHWS